MTCSVCGKRLVYDTLYIGGRGYVPHWRCPGWWMYEGHTLIEIKEGIAA